MFDLKVPFKTHPRRPPCICCSCHTLSSERTFAANLCSLKINTFEIQTWIYIWRHQQILLIKKKTEIELPVLKANTPLRSGLKWLISGGVTRLDWNSKLGLLNLRSGAIATKLSGAAVVPVIKLVWFSHSSPLNYLNTWWSTSKVHSPWQEFTWLTDQRLHGHGTQCNGMRDVYWWRDRNSDLVPPPESQVRCSNN